MCENEDTFSKQEVQQANRAIVLAIWLQVLGVPAWWWEWQPDIEGPGAIGFLTAAVLILASAFRGIIFVADGK